MKFTLIVFFALVLSACQKQVGLEPVENPRQEAKVVDRLVQTYGLSNFDVVPIKDQFNAITKAIDLSGQTAKRVVSQIDMSSMRLIQNEKEGIIIALMHFKSTPEKVYAVKGSFIKGGFKIDTEILFGRKITDSNNGQIVIVKGKEALQIDVKDGHEIITPLSQDAAENNIIQVVDCFGNHGGSGFCQRERGESFAACYNAEKAEFCDGFFSCLAVDTQPLVLVTIALACECGARSCFG